MQTPETLICFDRLRERLIAGGVARHHVKRTLAELRDHYDDAIDDGLAQGLSSDDAADAAWRRLGHEDSIVATVLARPELRSLPARYPRFLSAAGPVLLWVLATVASTFVMIGLMNVLQSLGALPPPRTAIEPLWLQNFMNGLLFAYMRVLPIVIGIAVAVTFARHRLVPRWTFAGAALISLFSALSTYALTFPAEIGQSGSLSIGFAATAEEFPRSLSLAVINAGLIFLAYWLARRRLAP